MKFAEVAKLVIDAAEIGIVDDIDISKSNGWINFYYGGLDNGKSAHVYFGDGKIMGFSKKEVESLKRRIKRARERQTK